MSTEKKPVKRLRDVHAEATRAALTAAARRRFSQMGFAGTSLDDVASDAGTTKGAVYHHFKDKKALFRAVYEEVSQELISAIAATPGLAASPGEAALHAFLVHAGEPACQRVLFMDGPMVLGAAECRAIDTRYSLGLLNRLIESQVSPDLLASNGIDALSKMLLAVFVESAQIIAASPEPEATMVGIKQVLNRMIVALSVPQEARGA